MRLIRRKFTVRRMMVAVAVTAAFMAGCIQAGKWVRLAAASREYEKCLKFHIEGRVLLSQCVEKSRRLMDARIALSLTRKEQAAAIMAHVERITPLIVEERQWSGAVHDEPDIASVTEAEISVIECKKMLERLSGNP